MALFAVEIPKDDREFLELVRVRRQADLLGALQDEILGLADRADAGEIALDVGAEDGDAGIGKTFGEDLQGDGLAGSGGAGDQAMAVAELQLQILALVDRIIRLAAGADKELAFFQHVGFISVSSMKAGGSRLIASARHRNVPGFLL
ncbi:hypothetical protein D9M70_411560 [compost metagenome]